MPGSLVGSWPNRVVRECPHSGGTLGFSVATQNSLDLVLVLIPTSCLEKTCLGDPQVVGDLCLTLSLNCSRPLSEFGVMFLLTKITMNFPYFRFLELRNEFYGIDLPQVGYCPTKTRPTFSSFFCFCHHRPLWPLLKMDNILGSVDENNTGDGQTLSCVPQECPIEISGPTVDVTMCSGKKKAHFKITKLCRLQKSQIT